MTFGFGPGTGKGLPAPARCTPRMATVPTPAFMPVGTAGTVKAMTADAVRATGADDRARQHLPPDAAARGGAGRAPRRLAQDDGLAGPILTDSGGFQVMSLAKLRTLDEDGVTFRSHLDGSRIA